MFHKLTLQKLVNSTTIPVRNKITSKQPELSLTRNLFIKRAISISTYSIFNLVNDDFARKKIIADNRIRVEQLREEYPRFTKHSLDKIIDRKILPLNILHAFKNPLEISSIQYDNLGRPTQRVISQAATFIINPETRTIVTVYRTSTAVANKLLKKLDLRPK